jgi:DNA-binding response OmpR family regulator
MPALWFTAPCPVSAEYSSFGPPPQFLSLTVYFYVTRPLLLCNSQEIFLGQDKTEHFSASGPFITALKDPFREIDLRGGRPWDIGDAPTQVLLVGDQWEILKASIMSLASQGGVVFTGPVTEKVEETAARTESSVLVISPGSGSECIREAVLKNQAGKLSIYPSVLLCITHETLETNNLYTDVDDFLVVPCTAAELGIRIRRLAQRNPPSPPSPQLRIGKIALDLHTYQVTLENQRIDLAWMEFQLLKFLMKNPGRVFTREQLLANVWGLDSFNGTRTVDVHIRRLRSKLEVPGGLEYFRTVKNVGYSIISPL